MFVCLLGSLFLCFWRQRLILNPGWPGIPCNPLASAFQVLELLTGVGHHAWLGSALFCVKRPVRNGTWQVTFRRPQAFKDSDNFTMELGPNSKAHSALVSTKDFHLI